MVIEYAKQHGNRAAAKNFGEPPTESTVRDWRREEEKLKTLGRNKCASCSGIVKWPQLEEDLKIWITNNRNSGIAVSTKMIILEAGKMAKNSGLSDFMGTPSWCYRFMKRHGLTMRVRTRIAQKMPQEYEQKIIEFHRFVIRARNETNFELGQIANMDEVPLTFDVPSTRTVDKKGVQTVTVKTTGHEKTHYTVVLACTANGEKLLPMLIFKRKTLPKEELPNGVIVHVQPKGWMDEDGMKVWMEKVWEKRPGGLLKKQSLLVLDQFKAHITEKTKKRLENYNTKIAVIPGGLTSQLQPLDVSINKPFKAHMREEWIKWMLIPTKETTPTGRVKRPSISQVCQWVKTSWDAVEKGIVIKSFKKCGISNNLDGTEDEMLYEKCGSEGSSIDGDLAEFSGFEDNEFSGFEDSSDEE